MKSSGLSGWSLVWLLATVLLVVGGALNLSQRAYQKLPPTDGVVWEQGKDGVYAKWVEPGFSASRAGVITGDRLLQISLDGQTMDEVTKPADVAMFLDTAGVDGSLTYYIQHPNYQYENSFYIAEIKHVDQAVRWTPSIIFLTIVGILWLAVGAFVLFKQGSRSPFVLHFATLCLAAFVFHVYRPIGWGQDLDLAISMLDDLAFSLFAPIFLHFCIRYPVSGALIDDDRRKTFLLYLPAVAITAVLWIFTLIPALFFQTSIAEAMVGIIDRFDLFAVLDRTLYFLFIGYVSAGAGFLIWRFYTTTQPIVKQRLKWAIAGTLSAVLPIISLQAASALGFEIASDDYVGAALKTLPLALIPLSFGHSVVRYRLMDVDVVVRRSLVYALTTLAIAMMIGGVALGLVFLAVGNNLTSTEITLRALIAVVAMAGIVLISEPLRKFLQERADRFFYGERYDLRNGLLDFGRTLSATTALDPLLAALTERLRQVLDVQKLAVFVEDERSDSHYRLAKSIGIEGEYRIPQDFRTMIRLKSAGKGVVRIDEIEPEQETETPDGGQRAVIRQELHYFVPCVARGKMVAVIGLGRAGDGSLLSSEDLEILKTISGYIAVAIENSRLYDEQRQHTEELAMLKEFNESIVESVNVGLLAVDPDGRIIRCNSTFEAMLGYTREETVGRLVDEIFDESFQRNLDAILGRARWHLSEIRNVYKMQTTDAAGRQMVLNMAIAPLRSESNYQTGAIIVLEDVTSRIKLEETLQQSEKLSSIGLLAAGVAHEVNTPLTGVSSYTQMLLGMIPDTDPKHALLEKMQRQTERASNIVGNLLNFSRVGTSGDFDEVNINKLLNDTIQLIEPQLRRSQIEIIKDYAESSPKVMGNAGKLQQVFTNLILNARDAMYGEGRVTLTTRNGGGDVVIEVADTGEGIPEENISKIFDPFFTTKGVGNGTGLGLAVTYGIVQEHGGTIEAVSEKGDGTTFRIVFPTAAAIEQRAVS